MGSSGEMGHFALDGIVVQEKVDVRSVQQTPLKCATKRLVEGTKTSIVVHLIVQKPVASVLVRPVVVLLQIPSLLRFPVVVLLQFPSLLRFPAVALLPFLPLQEDERLRDELVHSWFVCCGLDA